MEWWKVGMVGQKRVARHWAAPSLGHYAALSFIVRGGGEIIWDCGLWKGIEHRAPGK
jgi:hypothetical protein